MLSLQPRVAMGQMALQNAIGLEAAGDARVKQQELQVYTYKYGDFKMLVTPSLQASYNDNINLTSSGVQDDFIFSPLVNLTATYPLTAYNVLNLNIGLGYNEYLNHSSLNSWVLQSGSGLSFDILVKNFTINLHDTAAYVQNGGEAGTVNNSLNPLVANTSVFGTVQNTAGVLVRWNMGVIVLSLGYDHEIALSTDSAFQSQNQSTEEVVSRLGYNFSPALTVGIEASGSFMSYEQTTLNNNNDYTIGMYGDWQPSDHLHIRPRVGYSISDFQQTSTTPLPGQVVPPETGNVGSYYIDLSVTHQIAKAMNYSLSVGHETQAGIQSDEVEDWYFRPSINWKIIKDLGLSTSLSYENGTQGVGNIQGNLTEKYVFYGLNVGLNYPIIRRLTAGLSYQLTVRSSNDNQNYTQDIVTLSLSYPFK